MNVILIGFMGCGKSSVGRALAKALDVPFVDTDERIESGTGRIISDIFREDGESFFRDLETAALKELLREKEPMVIAVGGGLPVRRENRELLKKLGTTVYLTAETETLIGRLRGDSARPMLAGGELRQRILTLMAARGGIYEETADIKLSTDGKKIKKIVEEIQNEIR